MAELKRLNEKDLFKQVGQKATEIEDALNALAELDFAWACGELSASMQATRPQISKQPDLALKQARHPILVAGGGIKLVPNDLVLDADRRVLILTGPNTGGKTVALKTAGLCTLMGLCRGCTSQQSPSRLFPGHPPFFQTSATNRALTAVSPPSVVTSPTCVLYLMERGPAP